MNHTINQIFEVDNSTFVKMVPKESRGPHNIISLNDSEGSKHFNNR